MLPLLIVAFLPRLCYVCVNDRMERRHCAAIHNKSTNKLIKAEARGKRGQRKKFLLSPEFLFGQTNYAARSLSRDTQAQLNELVAVLVVRSSMC